MKRKEEKGKYSFWGLEKKKERAKKDAMTKKKKEPEEMEGKESLRGSCLAIHSKDIPEDTDPSSNNKRLY